MGSLLTFAKLINCLLVHNSLTVLLISGCLLLIGLHFYYKNAHNYWEKRGIKGPKPLPIFGNILSSFINHPHELERKWVCEYGKVYGTYHGAKPRLVIADPEIVRQICIKDFDIFPNHKYSEYFNEYQQNSVIRSRDEHWKKIRALMSPTFTSAKIKRMFKLLDVCADEMVQSFEEQVMESADSNIVNLKDLYSLYTLDAITTCCYGLKVERAGSANLKTAATRDDLVKMTMKIFDFKVWRLVLITTMPDSILRLTRITILPMSYYRPLAQRVKQVIEGRRKSGKKFDDYLQLLLDVNLNNKMELDDLDKKENHHAGLTHESLIQDQNKLVRDTIDGSLNGTGDQLVETKFALTDIETLSNAMFLMSVGLETTGNLLANCSYALAFHQDVQQRLYEEVKNLAKFNEDKSRYMFDYAALTSCSYLDAVISETLRTMATILQTDRDIVQDYHIEKYNITAEKGISLVMALYAILNDPDYWQEPQKFNPERFMPEKRSEIVPGSYCPFGLGPRHCLGMRFSLTEAKLALAKITMKFRFEPAPCASFPPEFRKTVGLISMKKPLVKLMPRVAL